MGRELLLVLHPDELGTIQICEIEFNRNFPYQYTDLFEPLKQFCLLHSYVNRIAHRALLDRRLS